MRCASSGLLLVALVTGCTELEPRDNPLDPAYTGPRGQVTGKIVLRSGKAITFDAATGDVTIDYSGVEVSVERIPGAVTTTSKAGDFTLPRVPVGTWTVHYAYDGYVTETVRAVGVRKNETTELGPMNLEEVVAGTLIFGSSREGWPSLFRSDPYGREIKNMSVLPIQSRACEYFLYRGEQALFVESEFLIYEKDGAYESAAGLYVARYPDLEPLALYPAVARMSKPSLTSDGTLVFGAEYNGDRFIAAARKPADLEGDWELLRITGSKTDKLREAEPAVSARGRLAYVRSSQEGNTAYEIRVIDDIDEPGDGLGALVWQRDFLSVIDRVSKSGAFDFDSDGSDDLIEFGTVFQGLGVPLFLAGIDWSDPITDAASYLEGTKPDGVVLDTVALLVELLLLGSIRDLAWLPDEDSIVFVDRIDSQPGYKMRKLWEIKNRGSAVTDYLGNPMRDTVTGRTTEYYFDINLDGGYSHIVDKPFWYDNQGSYVEALTVDYKRVEMQTLKRVTVSKPEEGDKYLFGAAANEWMFEPAVSPDGKRVALALGPVETLIEVINALPIMTKGDIITVDPANSFVTRVTTDGLNNRAPCWAP